MSSVKPVRIVQYVSVPGIFIPLVAGIVASMQPGNGVNINPLEMTLFGTAIFFGVTFFTAILVDVNESFNRRIELANGIASKEEWEVERQARTLAAIRNR